MRIQYLILSFFTLFNSCNAASQNELKEVGRYILEIDEPSGITTDGSYLYIVSDQNGKVFKTNFKGEILGTFDSEKKDLEGIAYNPINDEFAIISEEKRKIYIFGRGGVKKKDAKISGKQDRKNSGLEGVTFNTSNNSYYVVNEKKPRQILQLDDEFKVVSKFKLDFLDDISGLSYDERLDIFWVVSDESRSIFKVTTKGELIAAYPFNLKQMEGITHYKNKLYVVSDAVEVLVVFQKPN